LLGVGDSGKRDTAFMMAWHERLGKHSGLTGMEDGVAKMITHGAGGD
jgi:hypothetical protein